MSKKISNQEKQWRAESDAHTLIEAELIKKDQSRVKSAGQQVKRIAVETQKRAKAINNVAHKVTKSQNVKPTRRK